MEIKLPSMLTAKYGYKYNHDTDTIDARVIVKFGDVEVASLDPIRDVDPYSHRRDEEEQAIAEETVALWLREKLA